VAAPVIGIDRSAQPLTGYATPTVFLIAYSPGGKRLGVLTPLRRGSSTASLAALVSSFASPRSAASILALVGVDAHRAPARRPPSDESPDARCTRPRSRLQCAAAGSQSVVRLRLPLREVRDSPEDRPRAERKARARLSDEPACGHEGWQVPGALRDRVKPSSPTSQWRGACGEPESRASSRCCWWHRRHRRQPRTGVRGEPAGEGAGTNDLASSWRSDAHRCIQGSDQRPRHLGPQLPTSTTSISSRAAAPRNPDLVRAQSFHQPSRRCETTPADVAVHFIPPPPAVSVVSFAARSRRQPRARQRGHRTRRYRGRFSFSTFREGAEGSPCSIAILRRRAGRRKRLRTTSSRWASASLRRVSHRADLGSSRPWSRHRARQP